MLTSRNGAAADAACDRDAVAGPDQVAAAAAPTRSSRGVTGSSRTGGCRLRAAARSAAGSTAVRLRSGIWVANLHASGRAAGAARRDRAAERRCAGPASGRSMLGGDFNIARPGLDGLSHAGGATWTRSSSAGLERRTVRRSSRPRHAVRPRRRSRSVSDERGALPGLGAASGAQPEAAQHQQRLLPERAARRAGSRAGWRRRRQVVEAAHPQQQSCWSSQ